MIEQPPPLPVSNDQEARYLERFGHKQILHRAMGWYSSFALSVAVLAITITLFTLYAAGFQSIGGAAVWIWVPVIGFGLLLSYIWGHLAAAIPLSGISYQWTARLVGPRFGFIAGWTQLVAWYLGTAAIALAAGTVFAPVIFAHPTTLEIELTATVGVLLATAANLAHVRVAAVVNNIGTTIEIIVTVCIGVAIAIGLFFFHSRQPVSFLTSTTPVGGGTIDFNALAAALLLPTFVILGWDACADLAEEAQDTRRTAPSVMMQSVIIGGGICFVLYILLGLAIPGSPEKFFSRSGNPLLNLMGDRFGSVAEVIVEIGVAWAFMSAIIANMAGASRVSYGLARDNMLPGSRVWGMVGNRSRTPVGAILIAGGIGILFSYLSEGIASRAIAIVAVAGYMVYAFIAGSVIVGVLRGNIPEPEPGLRNLGRWLLPASVVGFLWCVAVILILVVPKSGHTGFVYFLVAEAIGVAWLLFGLVPRMRRGVAGPVEARGAVVGTESSLTAEEGYTVPTAK